MPKHQIDTETLLHAYASGVFPMAENASDDTFHWIKPPERGLIPLDGSFHVPRSLRKTIRNCSYTIQFNQDFATVLALCAGDQPLTRPRNSTWINTEIRRLYQELHQQGHAHSLEVYDNNMLIGGLYGVALGGAFFGESMFSRVQDTSKIALVALVEHLRTRGFVLLDCQFITPHLQQFGAFTVSAQEYDILLAQALKRWCIF